MFRAEVGYVQREAVDLALLNVADSAGTAALVARHYLTAPDAGPSTRLRAAELILGKAAALKYDDIAERLDRLVGLANQFDKEAGNGQSPEG